MQSCRPLSELGHRAGGSPPSVATLPAIQGDHHTYPPTGDPQDRVPPWGAPPPSGVGRIGAGELTWSCAGYREAEPHTGHPRFGWRPDVKDGAGRRAWLLLV